MITTSVDPLTKQLVAKLGRMDVVMVADDLADDIECRLENLDYVTRQQILYCLYRYLRPRYRGRDFEVKDL